MEDTAVVREEDTEDTAVTAVTVVAMVATSPTAPMVEVEVVGGECSISSLETIHIARRRSLHSEKEVV
jgi:hypothetical protein